MNLTQKQIGQWGLCWYNDPGHGWLRVPVQAIADANLMGRISRFSYFGRGNRVAYLEEDCDAPLFLDAVGFQRDGEATIPEKTSDGDSFIRRLPAFVVVAS